MSEITIPFGIHRPADAYEELDRLKSRNTYLEERREYFSDNLAISRKNSSPVDSINNRAIRFVMRKINEEIFDNDQQIEDIEDWIIHIEKTTP